MGGGHAHVLAARDAEALREAGAEVLLLDPGAFWYSGLATGAVAGRHPPERHRVPLADLCARHGARYVRDRTVGIDPSDGRLLLASGGSLRYDLLSLDIGSEIDTGALEVTDGPSLFRAKPIPELARLRRHLVARLDRARGGAPVPVAVVGGGPTGCEVAACVEALSRRRGGRVRVTLLSRAPRLLPGAPAGAARSLRRRLEERGIRVETAVEAARAGPDGVRLGDGTRLPAAAVFLATGLRPPRSLGDLGLPLGPRDGLRVDRTLRVAGREAVFGAGDCVDLEGRDLPRLGVYAVRQAPVLLHNLRATLRGEPLRDYDPQRRALSILDLGDGEALATWGPLWWRSRGARWLKDRLDRRFLARLGA